MSTAPETLTEPTAPAVGFGEATRAWVRIGLLSFGGPAGQIALMHRVLVEEKRWIDEARFLHALNYCMLLPGPEAQQLATYVGWLLHGVRGGVVAGTLFILPGALVMLALATLYAGYADLTLVSAAFFGIKTAVLVVVVEAVLRIGRRALKSHAAVAVAVAAFVAIFFLGVPFPLIVLAAAATGTLLHRIRPGLLGNGSGHGKGGPVAVAGPEPDSRGAFVAAAVCLVLWALPIAGLMAVFGPDDVFTRIALFFSKMAIVTFGGAYAVLSYVAQQAVGHYGWLAPGEMLDGLGLAETTPGPLILVTQFVGFMAAWRGGTGALTPWEAGAAGAALTLWVTFVPCFLWIFLGAPFIERLRGNHGINAAMSAITAAVVGVVLNLGVWFALHVFFATVTETAVGPARLYVPDWGSVDPAAIGLSLLAAVALLRFKVPMLVVLAGAAGLGMLLAG